MGVRSAEESEGRRERSLGECQEGSTVKCVLISECTSSLRRVVGGSTRRGRIDANTVYQEDKSEPCKYGYESQLAASGLADVVDDE